MILHWGLAVLVALAGLFWVISGILLARTMGSVSKGTEASENSTVTLVALLAAVGGVLVLIGILVWPWLCVIGAVLAIAATTWLRSQGQPGARLGVPRAGGWLRAHIPLGSSRLGLERSSTQC